MCRGFSHKKSKQDDYVWTGKEGIRFRFSYQLNQYAINSAVLTPLDDHCR